MLYRIMEKVDGENVTLFENLVNEVVQINTSAKRLIVAMA